MNDEFMFKLAQIRGSYTRKRFGTINNEEKALIDYETFCLELIKDYEKLEQENKELHNKIDKVNDLLSHFSGGQLDENTRELAIKVEEILKGGDVDE